MCQRLAPVKGVAVGWDRFDDDVFNPGLIRSAPGGLPGSMSSKILQGMKMRRRLGICWAP